MTHFNQDETFEFSFNDPQFSDRVLQIKIMRGLQDDASDGEEHSGIARQMKNLMIEGRGGTSDEDKDRELSMLSNPTSDRRFIEQAYANKRVKVVESDQPRPSCIVYLDRTRQECSKILTSDRICSDELHLKQQPFFIVAANTGTQDSSV
ncbi:hypothetical protein QJS04_geneDACA010671 [Acorus gramineus]|uniref:Uncharacterized protein n=1 Tax=Acorus gramineus TaxID=55184 RepID=A0AAV9AMN3_ACOGR|nr:hypothetical protein QJS04_geneDACA010671 [Acorus gramineus]